MTNLSTGAVSNSSKPIDRLSWIRSIFFLDPLIYLYTVMLGVLSLLSSFVDRGGRIQHGFARVWSWLILKTILSPVEVIGLENIDRSQPAVFAANHISALDIPLIYSSLPVPFRILAKKELFRYPFMGWHLSRSGQIPVDDKDARSNLRSLARAGETVKSGMDLMVFPEGGRSQTGQIRPFLSGAFYVAIKAGVPVIPMAIVGTYEVLPMNTFQIRPGKLELVIGKPIATAEYSPRDMDKLSQRVQKEIEDMYYSRSRVADPRKQEAAIPD